MTHLTNGKRKIRRDFRVWTFERDRYHCVGCGRRGYDRQDPPENPAPDQVPLDAHHISPRDQMPGGGYVVSNGATCCDECHKKAEAGHPAFTPEKLYAKIGSSLERAVKDSNDKFRDRR